MRYAHAPLLSVLLTMAIVSGCGGAKQDAAPASEAAPAADGALTAAELENGVGPVTQAIELGPIDGAKVASGKTLFEGKCQACHKFDERYVGPALAGVTDRRSAAYIMNMILNPEGMTARHPAAHQLLAEHMTQMPNLGLTQDQAREIVEFFRSRKSDKAAS